MMFFYFNIYSPGSSYPNFTNVYSKVIKCSTVPTRCVILGKILFLTF